MIFCTSPWTKSVSTTNDSNFHCKAEDKQTAGPFGSSRERMGFLWLQVIGHRKRVSRLRWRFRSFYFSNNWEMLNTEQIKMPQSKLQNTGYQPVEALFFLYCQLLLLCSFSLSAAPPSPDQCVQKVNRNDAYNSVISIAGFGTLAHKPGSTGDRVGAGGRGGDLCGGKSRFYLLFTKAHW